MGKLWALEVRLEKITHAQQQPKSMLHQQAFCLSLVQGSSAHLGGGISDQALNRGP
jgi:hypothetical protein